MHSNLTTSARYKAFTAERDRALERIHQNAQIDCSRILFTALEQIERLTASLALKAASTHMTHQLSVQFENQTRDILTAVFPVFIQRIMAMRKALFILTYASEQEAIGRATQREAPHINGDQFRQKILKAQQSQTLLGAFDRRVWLSLMTLRHRIVHAFEVALTKSSMVSGDEKIDPQTIVNDVIEAFPGIAIYKRPPAVLKRLREAAGDTDDDEDKQSFYDFDFIDDADWDLAVDAYKGTSLPPNRFDDSASYDPDTGMMKYQWELENELTEDFVKQVRDGKIDAAKDLGIEDFVWIAIIDSHTCDECCIPRNGHTTSEIETMLTSGEIPDDCDATSAPAHFKCRCDNGPVASTNEVEGPDWESFNEWLEPEAA